MFKRLKSSFLVLLILLSSALSCKPASLQRHEPLTAKIDNKVRENITQCRYPVAIELHDLPSRNTALNIGIFQGYSDYRGTKIRPLVLPVTKHAAKTRADFSYLAKEIKKPLPSIEDGAKDQHGNDVDYRILSCARIKAATAAFPYCNHTHNHPVAVNSSAEAFNNLSDDRKQDEVILAQSLLSESHCGGSWDNNQGCFVAPGYSWDPNQKIFNGTECSDKREFVSKAGYFPCLLDSETTASASLPGTKKAFIGLEKKEKLFYELNVVGKGIDGDATLQGFNKLKCESSAHNQALIDLINARYKGEDIEASENKTIIDAVDKMVN